MARDDFRLVVDHGQHLVCRREDAARVAAAAQVDIGQGDLVEKQVAHVDDISVFPENDAVAVRMAVAHMLDANFVAVQMQLDPVMIGDHGQGFGSRRRSRVIALDQAIADMVMGHNEDTGLAEILVAAGMIAMPVGVDHIFHRFGTKILHGGVDLAGQRGKLVVDQHSAIGTIRNADIAAGAEQYGDSIRQRLGLDLDLGEPVAFLGIALAAGRKGHGRGRQQQRGK